MSYIPGSPDLSSDVSPASDPIAQLFLARLRRLRRMHPERGERASREHAELVAWGIYSTFRDLQALGLESDARAILKESDPESE